MHGHLPHIFSHVGMSTPLQVPSPPALCPPPPRSRCTALYHSRCPHPAGPFFTLTRAACSDSDDEARAVTRCGMHGQPLPSLDPGPSSCRPSPPPRSTISDCPPHRTAPPNQSHASQRITTPPKTTRTCLQQSQRRQTSVTAWGPCSRTSGGGGHDVGDMLRSCMHTSTSRGMDCLRVAAWGGNHESAWVLTHARGSTWRCDAAVLGLTLSLQLPVIWVQKRLPHSPHSPFSRPRACTLAPVLAPHLMRCCPPATALSCMASPHGLVPAVFYPWVESRPHSLTSHYCSFLSYASCMYFLCWLGPWRYLR